MGEDGVDAGGVFREGMSRMVEDLFSSDFDLLIPCPNGQQAIGQVNIIAYFTSIMRVADVNMTGSPSYAMPLFNLLICTLPENIRTFCCVLCMSAE